MEIDKNLLKEFAQITNDSEVKTENKYLRGTIVKNSGGKYVRLDGSTTVTPIFELVDVEEGDRVLVTIENHKATIVGNFTFPPSARKEDEAINKAGSAQESANNANETANAAQIKAQEASTKADTAISQSSIASASADEAKQQAADALDKADAVTANVNEAKELATQANTSASEAKDQAAASQAASAEAQSEVTRLNREVTSAQKDINNALDELNSQAEEIAGVKENYATKIEVGNTKADLETEITKQVGNLETKITENYSTKTENVELEGRLQTQITQNAEGLASQASKTEKLEADTTQAQKDVAEALDKAGSAQTAATDAQNKAKAAQTAADTASTNATAAAEKATLAKNAADAATTAANNADKAVQSAKTDLDEAKKNLATVTSRVDATETDIAEAQSKVDAAQTAVNNALADAAEANLAATKAKEAADKAQQDADTAQGVATDAQQKADNAKTAADNAQAAADKAQADVTALTKRVITAETNIKQNSEAVEVNAKKTTEIGTKLDNLKVGGRNYILNTDRTLENTATEVGKSINIDPASTLSTDILESLKKGDTLDLSIEIKVDETLTIGTTNPWVGIQLSALYDKNGTSTGLYFTSGATNDKTSTLNDETKFPKGKWVRIHYLYTLTVEPTKWVGVTWLIRDVVGKISTRRPQACKSNTEIDWTPAPEDIDSNINSVKNNLANNYYNKTETDAKIKVESDKISSTVTRVDTIEKTANSAKDSIDNLEVGGRNFVLGTSNEWSEWINLGTGENRCKVLGNLDLAKLGLEYGDSLAIQITFEGTDYTSLSLFQTQGAVNNSWSGDNFFTNPWRLLFKTTSIDTMNSINKCTYVYDLPDSAIDKINSIGGLIDLQVRQDGANAEGKFRWKELKIEKGNKITDWTPAPEDIDSNIANVEDSITNRIDSINTTIEKAQSTIDQLSNMISHLITDNNGGSLMTQTSNGWTFNMSSITGNLNAIKDSMASMQTDQNNSNSAISKLTNLINDVANKTAYITIATDENNNPCIELGKSTNEFKVRITNTAIDFLQGSAKIAYANNNTFYTTKMIVKNELQIGPGPGFVWRTRSNGNMGLAYISS